MIDVPLPVVDKAIKQIRQLLTTSTEELEVDLTNDFTLHVNVECFGHEYPEIEISDIYILDYDYNVVENSELVDYIGEKLDATAKRINAELYAEYSDYPYWK